MGRLIAVGSNGSGNGPFCATSDDGGTTWTQRTMPGAAGVAYVSVCGDAAAPLVVAVGNSVSGPACATSDDDGVTWTARTIAAGTSYRSVAYGVGTWVAVGSTHIAYSSDGVTWSTVATGGVFLLAVCWDGEKFLAVGDDGVSVGRWASSPDGINWTFGTISQTVAGWQDVAYYPRGGIWIAASGNTTGEVAISPDREQWRVFVVGGGFGTWRKVAVSSQVAVLVGEVSGVRTSAVAYSFDGEKWKLASGPELDGTVCATFVNGSTGDDERLYTIGGPDGAQYVARSLAIPKSP